MKSVLITGVAGFIGSNLLDLLIEETDCEITGIDNLSTGNESNIVHHFEEARFKFINDDLENITSVKQFDTIFHLAALPRIQPSFELISEHIHANLNIGVQLIEIMIKESHFPKLVYSGSSAIYGTPLHTPTTEEEKIECLSPYAFQKYEFERYLELISTRFPLNYVTLRYFNPYGPRSFNPSNSFNAYSSVVGIFLNQQKLGKHLQVTGDGNQKRDFIHVKDVARANLAAANTEKGINDCFNVGFGETISINDLAKLISPNIVHIEKREGESEITHAEIGKIHSILNWRPLENIENYISKELQS